MADTNYAARLLLAAHNKREFKSCLTGLSVPASICERFDRGTPLNDCEAQAFAFVNENLDFIASMLEYARDLRNAGHQRYGIQAVVERARWDKAVTTRGDDEFKINDHVNPYLGRILNEIMEAPFFTARSVLGEPDYLK